MKLISLFSGCGGLDLGFKKAGFEIVIANEFDRTIWATFRHNHPDVQLLERDIRTIKDGDLPSDIDGIIGAPRVKAGLKPERHEVSTTIADGCFMST